MAFWRNQQGTVYIGEYVLTLAIVLAAGVAMSKYVQRSLQGKLHDVRHYAMEQFRGECAQTNCVGKTKIAEQYEPYYVRSHSSVTADALSHKGLIAAPGTTAGTFFSRDRSSVQGDSNSNQLPPMNAVNDKLLGAR